MYAEPKIIGYISRGSFRPMPKVDSAIIKLIPKSRTMTPKEEKMFFVFIKAGFVGKRKQLANNLAKKFGIMKEDLAEILGKIGLKQDVRAENLSLDQWIKLTGYIKNY